jgi:hypothetical protein
MELLFSQAKRQAACGCTRPRCYVSCPTYLVRYAGEDERWLYLSQTRPPDRREVEVMPPGVPCFKGSSKSGRKRKGQQKKVVVNVWEGI